LIAIATREFAERYWPDFVASAQDYLRRSGEELTLDEELELLHAAAVGDRPDLWMLVAVQHDQLVAWAVVVGRRGTAATGPEVVVWQVYVWPGRARLRDLVERAMPIIEQYARGCGARRLTIHTRRLTRAYVALLRRLGWRPHSLTWIKEVPQDANLHRRPDDGSAVREPT
jgi:hypothetical protein